MPTRYQDGVAGSHCFRPTDSTCIQGTMSGLHDLTGSEHQIEHAYKASGRGYWISRVRNIRSNVPTRYQDGAAWSHGLGTPDRTCLRGIRTGLQDLTCSERQIVHAYEVTGRGWRISRVRETRSNINQTNIWSAVLMVKMFSYKQYKSNHLWVIISMKTH